MREQNTTSANRDIVTVTYLKYQPDFHSNPNLTSVQRLSDIVWSSGASWLISLIKWKSNFSKPLMQQSALFALDWLKTQTLLCRTFIKQVDWNRVEIFSLQNQVLGLNHKQKWFCKSEVLQIKKPNTLKNS